MDKITTRKAKRRGRPSLNGTNGVLEKPKPRAPMKAVPKAARKPPQKPSKVPGLTEGELEELKAALQEVEETKGDWSKDR
jgi:hypothetical protein